MSDERKDAPKFPPTIETPAVVADLADDMADESFAMAAGDGPTDGQDRIIVPKLRATRARIAQAVKPLEWLGYMITASDVKRVVEELDELLDGPKDAVPEREQS